MDHEKIKRLVTEGKVEAVASILANGSHKLANWHELPDAIILLLKGYSESKISEKEIVRIFEHLELNGIFSPEFKRRVRELNSYADLKESLSWRITFKLR